MSAGGQLAALAGHRFRPRRSRPSPVVPSIPAAPHASAAIHRATGSRIDFQSSAYGLGQMAICYAIVVTIKFVATPLRMKAPKRDVKGVPGGGRSFLKWCAGPSLEAVSNEGGVLDAFRASEMKSAHRVQLGSITINGCSTSVLTGVHFWRSPDKGNDSFGPTASTLEYAVGSLARRRWNLSISALRLGNCKPSQHPLTARYELLRL